MLSQITPCSWISYPASAFFRPPPWIQCNLQICLNLFVDYTEKKKIEKERKRLTLRNIDKLQMSNVLTSWQPLVPCFLCDLFGVSANKLKEQLQDTEGCCCRYTQDTRQDIARKGTQKATQERDRRQLLPLYARQS